MTVAEIAHALGGASRSGAWWRCRCPAHGSRGATLALRDGEHGLIIKCFAGCDARDILAELRRRGLLQDRKEHRRAAHSEKSTSSRIRRDDAARRTALAWSIWDHAQGARGSPVVRYLAGRRITIALPPTLRYAPALRRPDGGSGPAMVALVEHIEHGTVGVHRTWLARDEAAIWRRRDRASLGPIAGGAVRLAPAAETLMIGEGLETCLSAVQATGMPAWAALSTSGLRALVLPPIVREILILADNDANGAGPAAAHDAARRWLSEGRAVRLAMPPDLGDFNDVLIAGTEPRHVAA
jgi:putative DNA primase/helicase